MTVGSGSREVGLIDMLYFSKRIPYSPVQSLLTLEAPVSTYKFSILISIHFVKESVERI